MAAVVAPRASAQSAVVTRHVPQIVQNGQAKYVARLDGSETLRLALQLPSRNQDQLDALLADLYNPKSPNYHKWLSSQEFDIRFGPTREDFNALVSWAQAKGLTVTFQATNGRLIEAEASVETVNRVFHVVESKFHDSVLNRDFHAPDREPTTDLPFALLAVDGLEDSEPKVNHHRKDPNAGIPATIAAPVSTRGTLGLSTVTRGLATTGDLTPVAGPVAVGSPKSGGVVKPNLLGSGPNGAYLPSDIRAAYYGTGNLTGAGQTVGIFSFDGYLTSDLALFYSATGTSTSVPVNNVLVGTFTGGCVLDNPCYDGEQILDIVNVQGMAPGLSQILFYENNTSANVILNQMASDNTAKVISSSWSGGGFGTSSDTYFQKMAAQGQSYLNATGDFGGFWKGNYLAPSLDPYITEVGGTDLTTASAGGAWSSEFGWSSAGGGFWITGMSASGKYTIPTWQSQAGVVTATNNASTLYRNSPDIAAEADFDNPTVSNGSLLLGYGGTSYATPRMAGYIALANQQAALNGQTTLGFLNPSLYTAGLAQQGGGTAYYHDSTSGSNPGINSSTYAAGGPTYYSVAGYDLVTGWGSPNGTALLNYLAGNPVANFKVPTTASGSMVRGGSVGIQLPVTGYNGYSGTIVPTGLSGLPSGWGAVYTGGTGNVNSPLQLYFSSPSTQAIGTFPFTVTVADSANSALTQNVNVSIVVEKRANGDFTMTTSGATVAKGSSGFAYIQVTPGSGLSGPVNLSVSGTIPGVSISFFDPLVQPNTPKNVPLTLVVSGATTPGTYSLTVTGADANGITHTIQVPVTITTPASVLVNGGFETGSLSPWVTTTTCAYSPSPLSNTSGFEPQTGNYFALMLSTGTACTQTMSQTVSIPYGSSRATFGMWVFTLTGESGTTAIDTLTVGVTDYTKTTHNLGTLSNASGTGYWQYYSYDMTQFMGQTVNLSFSATEAGATITDFFIDNVSLVVQ